MILIHEMDAIKCNEWKMFIILKDMKESIGYILFTLVHLPLYFICLIAIFNSTNYYFNSKGSVWIDILFILHSIIHYLFRNNKDNGFNNMFSQCVIYGMFLISIMRIILLY